LDFDSKGFEWIDSNDAQRERNQFYITAWEELWRIDVVCL